ncbi:hypothetical protein RI367_000953 [Sorochytrium milnesiophthora]
MTTTVDADAERGALTAAGGAHVPRSSLAERVAEAAAAFALLGVTAFGGPPAHIALLHSTFVQRRRWLSAELFSEYFAISQALPGPGSTEMLFSIAIHRGGIVPALVAFLCWSFPGLVVMTGLGLGVARLPNPLPLWLRQVQNGISSAAVGLVAQSALALSRKIVDGHKTLVVCTLSAAAAVLFSAGWLEPVLIAAGGVFAFLWEAVERRIAARRSLDALSAEHDDCEHPARTEISPEEEPPSSIDTQEKHEHMPFSWHVGAAVFAVTIALLVVFMVLKTSISGIRPLVIFTQFYVAGCIIFGGGPVVIPLLYSYVVTPGWVTERDFLLGVAFVQVMPGPNFNMAAYFGALALGSWGPWATIGGALLGYAGIFTPGLALNAAALPLWQMVRTNKVVVRALPGINAAAVGLVYAAAYLLWQRGLSNGNGVEPVGTLPYYAAVAGCAFVLVNAGVRPPFVMLLGAVAGVVGWVLHIPR